MGYYIILFEALPPFQEGSRSKRNEIQYRSYIIYIYIYIYIYTYIYKICTNKTKKSLGAFFFLYLFCYSLSRS
ncbi:hypothetical protein GGR50DRAFT_652819, partial [Xylaria sp. CBS 124048]